MGQKERFARYRNEGGAADLVCQPPRAERHLRGVCSFLQSTANDSRPLSLGGQAFAFAVHVVRHSRSGPR
jgi:hypothetical protein